MVVERTYTIPLRREWLKTARWRRTKKAVSAVRKFLARHMKSEDVRLGRHLNLELWKHGMQNPPCKIKVNVVKDDKGVVRAELFGAPVEAPPKEEGKKGLAKRLAEKIAGKKEETEAKKEAESEVKKSEEKIAAELKKLESKTKAIKEKEEKKPVKTAKKVFEEEVGEKKSAEAARAAGAPAKA